MRKKLKGSLLIEALVSLFIITTAFMGSIETQTFMQTSTIESSRRAQAYFILNSMVDRLRSNEHAAPCYAFTSSAGIGPYVGANAALPPACIGITEALTQARADKDIFQWDEMLRIGGVRNKSGESVGGLKNSRGCISVDTTTNPNFPTYTVSVAWEGTGASGISSGLCAKGSYGDDSLRRVISAKIQVTI